jgi:hypothetical protein
MASSPTGRLTTNTALQSASDTSIPPSTGPEAAAIPATPPHAPTARARSALSW